MTLQYMLDTDSVSYALRGHGAVAEHKPSELCINAVTLAELRFGADKRGFEKLHRLIDAFIAGVSALPFDTAAAAQFGRVAASLAARRRPIGGFDAMIAAHAVANELVWVTNNGKHFGRVSGLRCEN